MQITETNASGLKRELKVVVPAQDIEAEVTGRLAQIARTVKMPGFRPGKVPMPMIRQRYGQSVMGEVLEKVVNDTTSRALSERQIRPALQPRIQIDKFAEGADLEFTMMVEQLPDVEPGDLSDVKLERLKAEPEAEAVDNALQQIARSRRRTEAVAKKRGAKLGDIAVIDFAGTVDGEAKPGMDGKDYHLELGSGSFIDTFEEQLVGAKPGEHRTVKVTFPEGYAAAELAGREAVFEVDVKELREPVEATIDDAFAKEVGFDDLEGLKNAVREQITSEYDTIARTRLKRELLDKLAERFTFDVPQGMVDAEFDMIWKRLQEELQRNPEAAEEDKSEDELKAEYRAIAERRVRLGLVLAEIGRRNNVQVTPEELNRAVMMEVRRYPGQENQVYDFFRKNPQAIESLRAPLFEEKVVDHILTVAKVSDRKVSVEELTRDPDEADAQEKPKAKKASKPKKAAEAAEAAPAEEAKETKKKSSKAKKTEEA